MAVIIVEQEDICNVLLFYAYNKNVRKLFHIFFRDDDEDKRYEGDVVDLEERYFIRAEMAYDGVPTVFYDIMLHGTNERVGTIDLRFSLEGDMYYYGHVGYHINKPYRGHSYAYHACRVLFGIAKEEYHMDELIITCSPENIASYKTLKKLGGELLEVVDVPEYHPLYKRGETQKYIFKYKIKI